MIYQKVSEIMLELSKKGKIRREEIVPTMLPLLAEKKLVIKPTVINDYKFEDNNASFLATYELVDTETYEDTRNRNSNNSSQYESIIVQLPAGGCDSEGKGRATYMASTGVYRQILQQIFAIAILEPDDGYENFLENGNNSLSDNQENVDNEVDNSQEFDEFEDDNSTLQEENTTKTIYEMTDEDIDRQFESY